MFQVEDILNLLPKEEAKKVAPKYYSNIVVALENEENTKEIFTILSENGLTFKTAMDIRILAVDAKSLKNAVELWKASNHINLIGNSITYLRFKSDVILSRITTCESVGKSYTDEEGNLLSFILNDDEWIEVNKGLNTSANLNSENTHNTAVTMADVFKEKMSDIEAAFMSGEAELTAENFDRYTELVNVYNNVIKRAIGYVENYEFGEIYIKNLVSRTALSDNEIIKAALIGSGNLSEEVFSSLDEIINLCLDESNLQVGGGRR